MRERQSRRDGGERSRLRFRTVRLCAKRGPQLSWWGFISKCGFCTVIDLWTACQKEETVTATSCWFTFSLEKAYFSTFQLLTYGRERRQSQIALRGKWR